MTPADACNLAKPLPSLPEHPHPGTCDTGCGETLASNGVLVGCGVCRRFVL